MSYYGTLADADLYHAARGAAQWAAASEADREAALLRGSDYVDQRYRERLKSGRFVSMFTGVKTAGRDQMREWPRRSATDYEGEPIPHDEVPVEVEHAAYIAALAELIAPGSLSPQFVATATQEAVRVGPISVRYAVGTQAGVSQATPNRPVVPQIDETLMPLLARRYEYPAAAVV